MKIAIITDIHHGPQSHTKYADWNGLPVLQEFVKRAAEQRVELLLDLGDHISDTSREADRHLMVEVVDVLKTFPGKRVHLLGNHDVYNLTVADNEEIFQQSMASRVHDLGEFRLIAWQPGVVMHVETGFEPAGAHLDWLVEALLADDRPAVIATHAPLSGQSQIGNYYFQRSSKRATYPDHARIRKAVEETGRAALWLSGHVHWNTITNVGNVHHVTIQSLSERFTTMPLTAAAHAELVVDNGQFTIDVFGNDPFHVRLPFRKSGDRPWLQPKPPFAASDRAQELEEQGV